MQTWRMFAQYRTTRGVVRYSHFGPQGYAKLGRGDGVVEVELIEDADGDYWGWVDAGDTELLYPSASFDDLDQLFMGATEPAGVKAAQDAGEGRVVRFVVHELTGAR